MSFRVLSLAAPFVSILPEIKNPERKIMFRERILWTAVCLSIFLICSQVPLYGIMSGSSIDPLYWIRAILASSRGTLMDLGISPIISSGMIMQVLVGVGLINVDHSVKEDKILYNSVQKLFGLVLTIGQALVQVYSGMYGPPSTLGFWKCFMIVLQLFISGLIIVLLDEILTKNYGLGSGISLFIATNVCETVIWRAFSPTTYTTGRGTEFEGAVIALFYLLTTRHDKLRALTDAFYRPNLPNMMNILATLSVFMVVIYLHGFRIEIPIKSQKQKGAQGCYPIKLFYTSNMPIILQSALFSNVFFVSQILYDKFPSNFFVKLLGVWERKPGYSGLSAVSGLSYYLTSVHSFKELFADIPRFFIYTFVILYLTAFFSKVWIEISGTSPKEVAKRLKDQGMVIAGHRDDSLYRELKKIIPRTAAVCGILVGSITIIADLLGTIGSGTGILLAVSIIYQYFEIFAKESVEQSKRSGVVLY